MGKLNKSLSVLTFALFFLLRPFGFKNHNLVREDIIYLLVLIMINQSLHSPYESIYVGLNQLLICINFCCN